MASNFSFGLVAFSEVSEILVLLAQTIVAFPLYILLFGGLVRTYFKCKALSALQSVQKFTTISLLFPNQNFNFSNQFS